MAKDRPKKADTAKKKKEKEWRTYSVEDYAETASGMVHFSFKTVNSNIAGGGVRLGPEDALALPYVSARTLLSRGIRIDPDYTKNTGKTANIAKQIRLILAGEQPETVKNAGKIKAACLDAFSSRLEKNCAVVSPRMRQLLLPRGDGYVAISPLGAAGLNAIVNARVAMHHETLDRERHIRIRQAIFGIGGANPQNVGGLVREMQRPLFFEGPTESFWIKVALSIYHKGIPLAIPRDLALEYRAWRKSAKARNKGSMPTDLRTRLKEKAYVQKVAQAILSKGRRARRVLEDHRDCLPSTEFLVGEAVASVVRGLVDPGLREKDWTYRFSWEVANRLAAFEFPDNEGGLGLDDGAVAQIARWVEEGLR
ncbi:MAG: hypothetical protein D6704_00635 [Nitrospirae bacterium]|nr:MAG: hypothetical protein D6704_00635 [Nitrospirota bacterium]